MLENNVIANNVLITVSVIPAGIVIPLPAKVKKAGIKNVEWLSFNMVKASSVEKRNSWLETVKRKLAK